MRQFRTVFKFEYTNYIKSKPFIIMTVIMLLSAGIFGSFPALKNGFSSMTSVFVKGDSAPKSGDKKEKAGIFDPSGMYSNEILAVSLPQYEWIRLDSDEGAENKVKSGDLDMVLSINGLSYQLYQKGTQFIKSSGRRIDDMIRSGYQADVLGKAGLSPTQVSAIQEAQPKGDIISVGKDISQFFWLGYSMLFLLYFTIIIYGQYVMASVVTEKSTKTMELLTTSAKPLQLIFGKVIGTGCAGLTQFGLFIVFTFLLLKGNEASWMTLSPVVGTVIKMSLSSGMFLYAIVFFLLGFFTFAFLYAACGSTVSRMEDANVVATIPVMFILASFMVAITGMANADATYIKVLSFVPFFSPLVLFMRVCVTDIPTWEMLIGILLNILYLLGVGYVCTKIYRVCCMLYGNTPKFKDLIRYIKQA